MCYMLKAKLESLGLYVYVTTNFPEATVDQITFVIQQPNQTIYMISLIINLNTFTIDKALNWNKQDIAWEPIPDIDPNDVDTIIALYLKT